MTLSHRQLAERHQQCGPRIEGLVKDRDAYKNDANACAYALEQVAGELSRMKDVVALCLVAAGHPGTVVHDVTKFAESLREALAANGVDIRLELARLEGADL